MDLAGLIRGIRGQRVMSGVPAPRGDRRLSRREQDVVSCLVSGMTNKEIAAKLGITDHTVKMFLSRVMGKLGVTTRSGVLGVLLLEAGGGGACDAFGGADFPQEEPKV